MSHDSPAAGRILVVEDDAKAAGLIRLYLEDAGFSVDAASNGTLALARALGTPAPQLVVLDVMLPGMDGFEVCRRLRRCSEVPVILVTARAGEEDRLLGLDLGADDYLTKPFSPRELVARVRAVLRRGPARGAALERLERSGIRLDPRAHQAHVAGRLVELTPREFTLLHALMRSPGRVFTREELVSRAFGPDFDGLERTIDVHVRNLRRKIEADPAAPTRIETVAGIGYRFADLDA